MSRVCSHTFIECKTLRGSMPHMFRVQCPDCDLRGPVAYQPVPAVRVFFDEHPDVRYVWRGGLKFRSAEELAADYRQGL